MENMEDIETSVVEIDGKEFFLLNTLDKYMFYVDKDNPEDFYIFKEVNVDGEGYIVSLDDEDEYDNALDMYYEKYGEAV